ncbi:glycosyltransferase [Methanoculleus sp.]|uniref:glycosyltransferase n=1 Tax=Methanoculleus sp. TaxID=90427 RepID=UPI0025FB05EC|nr:glycosyltransferase [Methanoculleus sp.]
MVRMIDTKGSTPVDLKDKTLLVLTPSYPNEDESFIIEMFVKYQVAELKRYFKKIIVIAPVLRSFGYLKKDRLCKDYTYDNVEVYFPRSIYVPILWLSKILIDNRPQAVERCIEEHHLHFDLIHAHFTWPSGYIGVRLKEKYGKPVITTIHENGDWFDREVGMDHPFINTAWSGADALIRVNQKDVPVLKRYNEQVYSIPNGFAPAFHPVDAAIARERLGLPGDVKIVFTLGNLIKRKGFNYLIDAMEPVCSQRDDVLCFIGGAGPERGSLQGQIDRLHLGEKVKLLGSVPSDILPLWMNACDLFVLPSLSESFGVVQIEALACGKPVVSARNRGSEEVIVSDSHGLLVEPADPDDLAEMILVALDREWDREVILGYVERFTWQHVVRGIVHIYQQISSATK